MRWSGRHTRAHQKKYKKIVSGIFFKNNNVQILAKTGRYFFFLQVETYQRRQHKLQLARRAKEVQQLLEEDRDRLKKMEQLVRAQEQVRWWRRGSSSWRRTGTGSRKWNSWSRCKNR